MARRSARSRPAPPPPPPEAPLAAELLRSPTLFFERLRAVPPQPARYAAPALLAALLGGVVYALLLRPVVGVTAGQTNAAPAFTAHIANAFGTFFLTVVAAALMAGLGRLGAGRGGRAPEVYGATFALLPPLYALLAALLLVLPGPDVAALAPGETLLAAQRRALALVSQAPLTRVTLLLMALGTLAQFVLAYRGFLTLTGHPAHALRGALLPLLPVLGITALGFLPLL